MTENNIRPDIRNMSTLCYLEKDGCYLMLHRVTKKNDLNRDKWIGIGGHFKIGESPEECLLREVYEETGYTLTSYSFRALVTFVSLPPDVVWTKEASGSGKDPARDPLILERSDIEYMSLFCADGFTGEETVCNEGTLEWVPIEKINTLNLWKGDLIFLRLLAEGTPFFSLKLVYSGKGILREAVLNGSPLDLSDYQI